MNDLVAFLRERLDEQEARARALPSGPWEWKTVEDDPQYDELAGPEGESILVSSDTENFCSWITRHDAFDAYLQDIQPARMLAEVEAKRRVIAQWEDVRAQARNPVSVDNFQAARIEQGALSDVLRLFGACYADHPDYKPEWRP